MDERLAIEQALARSGAGAPSCVVIGGEPGIGKRSLASMAAMTATGDLPSLSGVSLNLIPAICTFRRAQSLAASLASLIAQLPDRQDGRKDLSVPDPSHATYLEELTSRVCGGLAIAVDELAPDQNGIFLSLGPLDGASLEQLEPFWFDLIEGLEDARAGRVSLCLTVEARVLDVSSTNPAILQYRVLNPLSFDECVEAVTIGVSEANRLDDIPTAVTDKALQLLWELSGGYPHILQYLSFWSFEEDSDHLISAKDVELAAFRQGGAISLVSDKYYAGLRDADFSSETPRLLLGKLASKSAEALALNDLQRIRKLRTGEVQHILDDMESRGIVLAIEADPPRYRIAGDGLATVVRDYLRQNKNLKAARADAAMPLLHGLLIIMLSVVLMLAGHGVPITLALTSLAAGVAVIAGSRGAHQTLGIRNPFARNALRKLAHLLAATSIALLAITLVRA